MAVMVAQLEFGTNYSKAVLPTNVIVVYDLIRTRGSGVGKLLQDPRQTGDMSSLAFMVEGRCI